MLKKELLTLSLLFAFTFAHTQVLNFDFGQIPQAQLDMKTCSFDATADAVVIFDRGNSSFHRNEHGFDVIFKRHTRIKILNEAGKKYAEIEIPFYQEGDIQEKVTINKASTYAIANGQITKVTPLDKEASYVEKVTNNWKVKKFAMPDIQPGCIIEYEYEIISQYHFNLHDWDFQWRIPVLYSEYETRMIPFYEYSWVLHGRKSIDEYKTYEDKAGFEREFYGTKFYDMVYKFGLKNIPAFSDEEFLPSIEDQIIKIDFQLCQINTTEGLKIKVMTTWPELVSDYLKHEDFGRYIKKSENSASKIILPDSLKGKTQRQIFDYIVAYAKDNFNWDKNNSQFADKSVSDFLKSKIGNSADINLWLVGALRSAGLDADPVVLSTRSHGRIQTDYPFSRAFNFVVAMAEIDGKFIFGDATDVNCQIARLPIQCITPKGLIVNKEKLNWIGMATPVNSGLVTTITIDSINEEQNISVLLSSTEYEALKFRNTYSNKTEDLVQYLLKKNYQVEENSLVLKSPVDRNRPYSFAFKAKAKTEIINGKLYIDPFLNEISETNPLKQKTRTYPVDLTYPVTRLYKSQIVVPEGYKVEFLPSPSSLNDDLFELEYSATETEGTVNINFKYSFRKAIYSTEEYARIKSFFDRISQKGNEKIVFSQK